MIDAHEKAFLMELGQRVEWRSILKKLKREAKNRYKKKGESEESKTNEWIYESGRLDENDKLLSILTNGEYHE